MLFRSVDGQEAGRGVAVGHDDGAARGPAGGELAQEGEHHVLVVFFVVAHVDAPPDDGPAAGSASDDGPAAGSGGESGAEL